MAEQSDLHKIFQNSAQLVTLNVLYYRPDHSWLLQDFTWQTYDVVPRLPRIQKFLDFWRTDIEAVIHSVELAALHPSGRPMILTPGYVGKIH